MATFPTLTPSSRTFTPGRHPHSEIPTLDGLQTRVRTSNVILEQRLRLTFVGLTEAQMLSIRSHYIGQQGRFLSFAIPTSLLSGMTTPANFTPTGYSWIYGSAPQVEDIPCAQRYNVSVELVTVPPEGANINGAEFTVGITLATVTPLAQTITISFTAGAGTGTVGDPNFASVSLLLHMNGSNGSTTFTDSSSNSLTIGNSSSLVSIDTAQSKFGGASARFDGSESLNAPSVSTSSVFAMGTGDFTMECWFRISSHTAVVRTLMQFFDGSEKAGVCIGTGDTMTVRLSGTQITGTTSPAVDTWHHAALTRSSGDHRLFLNGVQEGSTWNNSYNQSNALIEIGQNPSGSQSFTGYIDDLRITKNVARYTATFTPPTAAFPDA
jgi:hypothetical protein